MVFSCGVSYFLEDPERRKRKQNLCFDAGYVGDEVLELAAEFGFTLHVRPRGRRSQTHQEEGSFQSEALGGGADTQLVESFSWNFDSLGEETGALCRDVAFRVRDHYLEVNRPTGISSYRCHVEMPPRN